jgi:ABC-type polysaccharide/polyol phosphate export permease
MNLIIIVIFFVWYDFLPSLPGIMTFVFYIFLTYTIIISFSFIAAPFYVQYRDISHIWEVVSLAPFYAAPIVYPLNILPTKYHPIILANPMGFIIHYTKTALTQNHWAPFWQNAVFTSLVLMLFFISLLIFFRLESRVADNL